MNFRPSSPSFALVMAFWASGVACLGWSTADTPPVGVVARSSFTVDATQRGEALSFYHHIYQASANLPVTYATAPVLSSCTAGSLASNYRYATLRRINFYRAMAGIFSNTTMDVLPPGTFGGASSIVPAGTLKSQCCQQAALYAARDNPVGVTELFLTHTPDNSGACYQNQVFNGAYHSNLAIGFNGPDAVDAYIREVEGNTDPNLNDDVGHRRWLLYSKARDFATGDIAPTATNYATNAIYVLDPATSGPQQFVAWPPAGRFCPAGLATLRWSLSHPSVNFNSATVTMTRADGTNITGITLRSRTVADLADNTIAWDPPAGLFPPSSLTDQVFNVTVSGMVPLTPGSIPATLTYQVKLFNPETTTITPLMTGSATPPQSGAAYSVASVSAADAYQVKIMTLAAGTIFAEGAENASNYTSVGNVKTTQSTVSGFNAQGQNSFHLRFNATNKQPQQISLNKLFIPTSTSQISFFLARRVRAKDTVFRLQITKNAGANWEDVYTDVTTADTTTVESLQLVNAASPPALVSAIGRPCQLRIRLESLNGRLILSSTDHNNGVMVDGIEVSNVALIAATQTTDVPAASVVNSKINLLPAMGVGGVLTPGTSYRMTYAPKISNYTFEAAPVISITPSATTGVLGWIEGFYPSLVGVPVTTDSDKDGMPNLIEFALGLDPLAKNAIPPTVIANGSLSMTLPSTSTNASVETKVQYSCDLVNWEDLVPTVVGSNRVYTKPPTAAKCGFLRIKARQL